MHIAIITAGGAGMFCGSCMHDNTWARALIAAGADVSLIPTYTPIRVDEENVSERRVFMGGINLYLEHKSRLWRRLPRVLTRPLDHPAVLRLLSRLSSSSDAAELGDLTLDMLAGESGPLERDVAELADHIAAHLRPDVVIFSNALLVGALKTLKSRFDGPVYCTLQGDDVFTDALPDSHRKPVVDVMSRKAQQFDGFISHTAFYRDYMAQYLSLPRERMHLIPLGIDLTGYGDAATPGRQSGAGTEHASERPLTIGYFARLAPEKGLHHLADAALLLQQRHPGRFRIKVGGYLGSQNHKYFADIQRAAKPLGDAFTYIGSPDSHAQKVEFLRSLDVLSVPTEFLEPKGLYVLEALASGVPVVQPAHGAFPELLEATGGGLLVEPKNPAALGAGLERLLTEPELRRQLAATGRANVIEAFSPQRMATATLELLGG